MTENDRIATGPSVTVKPVTGYGYSPVTITTLTGLRRPILLERACPRRSLGLAVDPRNRARVFNLILLLISTSNSRNTKGGGEKGQHRILI